MEIFDNIILNIIVISLPITIYLLYLAYTKTFNCQENELLKIVTIFSILYLIVKYGKPLYQNLPLIIINVPLILAYIKKSKISIIITSIIAVVYYYNFYQNLIGIIIFEYILYFIIALKTLKTQKIYLFILIFSIIKTVNSIILFIYSNNISLHYIVEILIEGLFLYITMTSIYYFLSKTEEVLKLHMNIKEIKQNEQIHTSLFQITHEIKNPIAVCKGYLDMFDKDNPKHFQKYIPILKEEINRTLLLLEDFLAMNKVKINKDIIDINLLIEEVVKNIKMLCTKNNIELNTIN